ncbi:MAG: hypothetical protein DU429_06025 [Candidatus Tokpelaia sp.]|nr:MAG: hypothetical protein DU429_06025 [Candidatus Tokpelaia sp.]KAA6206554.1 MAG: hypothetical protein DU430_00185 [Candidatus Tokpelaia sp.]
MPQPLNHAQREAAQDFLRRLIRAGYAPEDRRRAHGLTANLSAKLRLQVLKIRLYYERLRLGSDVTSPYLYKKQFYLQQKKADFHRFFPPLNIGQWLGLLASFDKKI